MIDTILQTHTYFPIDNKCIIFTCCVYFCKVCFHSSSQHARRSEIVQLRLNNNFSVQPNSCWHSSLCSLLSENFFLPLFLILRGKAGKWERGKEGEASIECWQGHNLPSLHTLFTVLLSAAITLFPQWSHKKQIGAFREIACTPKINNRYTSSPKKVSREKDDIGRLKVPHP